MFWEKQILSTKQTNKNVAWFSSEMHMQDLLHLINKVYDDGR